MCADESDNRNRWVGVDVGADLTATCIIDQAGTVVAQEEVPTSPNDIAIFLDTAADGPIRLVGIEASSLSPHLARGLLALGFPVAMFDSRQTRKFLRIRQNKTDQNDARGIAEIALHGRNTVSEVRLKSLECQKIRSQLAMRQHLIRHRISVEHAIRAIIRLNGGNLKKCTSAPMLRREVDAEIVRLKSHEGIDLKDIIQPALELSEQLRRNLTHIDKGLTGVAQSQEECRRFLEISGVGPISALSFFSAVEDPTRFKRNEDIGPYLGMVPRIKQSGPIVRRFGISRMGNDVLP